jgi:hypothetical protein
MVVMQSRFGRHLGTVALSALLVIGAGGAASILRDAPIVWHDDDRRDIPKPAVRDPNDIRAALDATLFRPLGRFLNPVRWVRAIGSIPDNQRAAPAANLNALDEVPSSSWFTNRIGLFPLTPADGASGPIPDGGPDTTGPLVVVSAKVQGVSPGFNVRDRAGNRYVIKFDPPGYPESSTAAGVIAGRILYAAGYNVPHDAIVYLRRDQLSVAPGVRFTAANGRERPMTDGDIDAILARVAQSPTGTWRALASRFLPGEPLGPFDWRGRRGDDPNDRVNHEDRRELRAFRMFAAWLCHYDTKQGNTLDMFVDGGGRHFVRHYFIDFASALGAGPQGPVPPGCHEYNIDLPMILGRAASLGLWQDPWRRIEPPEDLPQVGLMQSEIFHPMAFKPLEPTAAFANFTDRDGYWAAKIISAFRDEHLRALVAEGRYSRPEAAAWMTRALAERRDAIARYFFDRIPPLDFFQIEGSSVRFHDLGIERDLYPGESARYRYRIGVAREDRHVARQSPWYETDVPVVDMTGLDAPSDEGPFHALDLQVRRSGRWSRSVRVFFVPATGRVIALER